MKFRNVLVWFFASHKGRYWPLGLSRISQQFRYETGIGLKCYWSWKKNSQKLPRTNFWLKFPLQNKKATAGFAISIITKVLLTNQLTKLHTFSSCFKNTVRFLQAKLIENICGQIFTFKTSKCTPLALSNATESGGDLFQSSVQIKLIATTRGD